MTEKKQKGFDYVCRQKNLKENDVVLGLIESEKLIGQLYPVLVDEQGNVLDGQHRLKANPDWRKEVVKGLDSERKKAMIRLHANWHRRREHPDQVLRELAKVTQWKGSTEYAAFLGCSERTIQRYLPQQYKMRDRTMSKRQLSLSESNQMLPHEIEAFDKLETQKYEASEGYHVIETLKKGEPTCEWDEDRTLSFLANRLYNSATRHIEPPNDLLSKPETREECDFYLKILELRKTPQDKITAYLEGAHRKQTLDVQRFEHEKRLEKLYEEKLNELTKSVTGLILILKDGSKIEFDREHIPKGYSVSLYDYDLVKSLLEPYVQQLLGLDRFLRPIKQIAEVDHALARGAAKILNGES